MSNTINPIASDNKKTKNDLKLTYIVNPSILARSAKILTNKEHYKQSEVISAKDYANDVINANINYDDDLETNYQKLAQSLIEYDKNNISKNEIDEKMLSVFSMQNDEKGVSKQVLNEITLAYKQIGNHEALDCNGYGVDSGDEISKYFETGWYGSPWCAMFVSWLNDEGQDNPSGNKNTFGFQESVANIQQSADEAGFYESKNTYTPVSGDIMLLQDGGCSHTGIVYDANDKYVYTIEGNKCDMVRAVVYDKNGDYYLNHVSGYVKMNEWTDGNSDNNINTEFLPALETAMLPETQCYPAPNNWDDIASGGFVSVFDTFEKI